MKRIFLTIFFISILVFVSVLGSTTLSSNASAKASDNEVVILACTTDSLSNRIYIAASNSSANAPTVAQGTSCAQALVDLLAVGFEIEGQSGATPYLHYTLVNKHKT